MMYYRHVFALALVALALLALGSCTRGRMRWLRLPGQMQTAEVDEDTDSRASAELSGAVRYQHAFRRVCLCAAILWLLGLPVGVGLGLYLKSRALVVAGVLSGLMLPITYSAGAKLPQYSGAIALVSLLLLVAGLIAAMIWLARGLKGEGKSLQEVVATVQRTKLREWDAHARHLADGIQGPRTRRRVREIKRTLPREDAT